MTHAYERIYLEKARVTLGRMLDFAVYDLGYGLEEFWDLFLVSGYAKRFERGDCSVLVGRSGIELAYAVAEASGKPAFHVQTRFSGERSAEYWCGWALAYAQWESGRTFSAITSVLSITRIRDLYHPYHEMDIRQFCDKIEELLSSEAPQSNLKTFRSIAGLTQSELSERSGVPIRTLQQYEQRKKNINKANAEHLLSLAKALHCAPEELLEHDLLQNRKNCAILNCTKTERE